MNYIKSLSNDEMKSKLAPAAMNTSTATINSYSTAFYQVKVSDKQPTIFL